ncbi:hypothetical protein AAVH_40214, partial [Aphelenchoides avenae]
MAMLPNESLAEAIAFLKLFDLSGPLLTSRRYSALAADAALHIPVFYAKLMILSERGAHTRFELYARHSEIGPDEEVHENVEFPRELLPIALRNC